MNLINVLPSSSTQDFRSADGLYNLVKQKYPHAVVKGKDLFDANLFKDQVSTSVFYTFIAELKDLVNRASITRAHEFIKSLEDRGKLLRCYTQNIDGLEPRLGMNAQLEHAEPPARGRAPKQTERQDVRVVQLHGDLDSVICTLCRAKFDFQEEHREVFQGGEPPACPTCLDTEATRLAAGKRKLGIGTLRPNIVLYNEHHDKGACHFTRRKTVTRTDNLHTRHQATSLLTLLPATSNASRTLCWSWARLSR